MKKFIAIGTLAVLLGGCATTYRDGTSQSQLGPTTFTIEAGANAHSYLGQENDMAMLRAAEIACIKGYEYFEVIGMDRLKHGRNDYTTLTIELQKDKTRYHAPTIMENLKKPLNAEMRCDF